MKSVLEQKFKERSIENSSKTNLSTSILYKSSKSFKSNKSFKL